MYVYVCFDTEDLVHPDSDDVPYDVAEMLADDGIVASMCVVGEKARLWERRGRADVIASVARHDVILHTNRHSVHPTVAEYLADKGWADGVAEAVRQEGPGKRDIARIFGVPPSSWATPGSSWGPQIAAATRRLGIPSNVYSHARSGETGACWFAGQLCYSGKVGPPGGEDAYYDDATFDAALPALLQQIGDARQRRVSCAGLVAAHPTRLRYTAFWDTLNYAHGQNTDPSAYRLAPRRSDEEYATSLRNLRRTVLAVRDLPGVEIVPVRALNALFAPDAGSIAWVDVRRLARVTADSKTIRAGDRLASPAQVLDVLARAVLGLTENGANAAEGYAAPAHLSLRTVLGPVDPPPVLDAPVRVDAKAALDLCRQVVSHIDSTGHLPASLVVDGVAVGPGPLLKGLAPVFLDLDDGLTPAGIMLQGGVEEPAVAARLAEDAIYRRLPGWQPHRPDLKLDQLALHTRLQSWSLKPAVLEG